MRYLSGIPTAQVMQWTHGGVMYTPNMGNALHLAGVTWAADNGCLMGSDQFNATKWLRFLEKHAGQGMCQFAVLPDVPFDMQATLARSLPYLDAVHDLGYPAALAIQNGVQLTDIPWNDIEAVFIAGTVPFKTSLRAWHICRQAKIRGKYVHIARRNSKRALQFSYNMGADSVDGCFLKFAPTENWQRLQRWFAEFCPHNPEDLLPWEGDIRYFRCKKCGNDVHVGEIFSSKVRKFAA